MTSLVEIHKVENDYIPYGELSITRVDRDGSVKWKFTGADIFVSNGSFRPFAW